MSNVLVAILTPILTFAGVVLTVWGTLKKSEKEAAAQRDKVAADNKAQTDLILYRITELEKKQDKHNAVIERTYALEKTTAVHDEEIKVANHRIADLENKVA